MNTFLLIKRPLGNLTYLRLWHDNTGRGGYASWHVAAILVRDVQTNEKFEFITNRWEISRMYPIN